MTYLNDRYLTHCLRMVLVVMLGALCLLQPSARAEETKSTKLGIQQEGIAGEMLSIGPLRSSS